MCNRAFYVTIFDLFLSKGAKDSFFPNVERSFPQMFGVWASRRTLGRHYIFPYIFTINIGNNFEIACFLACLVLYLKRKNTCFSFKRVYTVKT